MAYDKTHVRRQKGTYERCVGYRSKKKNVPRAHPSAAERLVSATLIPLKNSTATSSSAA